jgi:hypothetical protein
VSRFALQLRLPVFLCQMTGVNLLCCCRQVISSQWSSSISSSHSLLALLPAVLAAEFATHLLAFQVGAASSCPARVTDKAPSCRHTLVEEWLVGLQTLAAASFLEEVYNNLTCHLISLPAHGDVQIWCTALVYRTCGCRCCCNCCIILPLHVQQTLLLLLQVYHPGIVMKLLLPVAATLLMHQLLPPMPSVRCAYDKLVTVHKPHKRCAD